MATIACTGVSLGFVTVGKISQIDFFRIGMKIYICDIACIGDRLEKPSIGSRLLSQWEREPALVIVNKFVFIFIEVCKMTILVSYRNNKLYW